LRLGLLLELPPRGATSLTKLVAVEQQRHEHDLATFRARARVALRQGYRASVRPRVGPRIRDRPRARVRAGITARCRARAGLRLRLRARVGA
jgi:hypothetical protein